MKKKILISTGGSGGHVVPATILYQHLKDLNEVSMTCDNRGLKFLNQKDYDLTIFNINPFKKNFFLFPLNIFKILFLTIKSFIFLKKKKDRSINIDRWLYVLTIMFSIKVIKHKVVFI